MAEDVKAPRRVVNAPTKGGATMRPGEVLSVAVGQDEEVEWLWSHDLQRGSKVTGYRIVPRGAQRQSPA